MTASAKCSTLSGIKFANWLYLLWFQTCSSGFSSGAYAGSHSTSIRRPNLPFNCLAPLRWTIHRSITRMIPRGKCFNRSATKSAKSAAQILWRSTEKYSPKRRRVGEPLSATAFSVDRSVFQTDSRPVPADCGPRKTPRLAVHRPDAIGLWLRALRQRAERSRLRDVPAGAKQSPCIAYPIIGQGFLWVSYPYYRQEYARLFNFSRINRWFG